MTEMSMDNEEAKAPGNKVHEVTIVVNGRKKMVDEKEISFDEVVALAFDEPPSGPNVVITVAYRHAHGDKSGTLEEGQSIKVKEGMIFDVTATDKS